MVLVKTSFERPGGLSEPGDASASFTGGSTVARPSASSVRAVRVDVEGNHLVVALADGRSVVVPLDWFPRLIEASPRERGRYQLIGDGTLIHWPDVDEDIDVPNLLRV